MDVHTTFVCCTIFLLESTGPERWERRARVLREGSEYLGDPETWGFFPSRHEDGVGVLAMPVSLLCVAGHPRGFSHNPC